MRRTKAMPLCVGERSARCRARSTARLDACCVSPGGMQIDVTNCVAQ